MTLVPDPFLALLLECARSSDDLGKGVVWDGPATLMQALERLH